MAISSIGFLSEKIHHIFNRSPILYTIIGTIKPEPKIIKANKGERS
jgi:hypothetical protein